MGDSRKVLLERVIFMESKKQVMNRKYPCTEPGLSFAPKLVYCIITSICVSYTGPHGREEVGEL